MNGRKWYLCGVILLLRGLRGLYFHATSPAHLLSRTLHSPCPTLSVVQAGWMDPGMGFRQSGNLPPASPVQVGTPGPGPRCQEGGPRCAHLHTQWWPRGALGLLSVQHCSAVEGGFSTACPKCGQYHVRGLSYIYFVGFSIAMLSSLERLDVASPLKLCLLSERLFQRVKEPG